MLDNGRSFKLRMHSNRARAEFAEPRSGAAECGSASILRGRRDVRTFSTKPRGLKRGRPCTGAVEHPPSLRRLIAHPGALVTNIILWVRAPFAPPDVDVCEAGDWYHLSTPHSHREHAAPLASAQWLGQGAQHALSMSRHSRR